LGGDKPIELSSSQSSIKRASRLDYPTATPNRPGDIDLVIFDCDGVLVDSEPITNRVLAQMIDELGIPMTMHDMQENFVGRSMALCCNLIEEMLGRSLPVDFLEQYRLRTTAAWTAELKAIRGVETVLDALESRNIPFCVASSSSHHEMRTTLGLTGLLPRFDNKLFSVTEVPAAKPAPDVYLYAASRYATAPSKCCVVEDSPTGVRAGAAAGMRVYGYCELTPRDRLTMAGAHFTVASMSELLKLWFGNASG
jgi:HAD superfamily hydrolase (TIGR01509 family)